MRCRRSLASHPHPCAACSDRRFGNQAQTISCEMQKLFKMHDRLYVGLNGLPTDVQAV
jgi:20S proteasome subunit beta 3